MPTSRKIEWYRRLYSPRRRGATNLKNDFTRNLIGDTYDGINN